MISISFFIIFPFFIFWYAAFRPNSGKHGKKPRDQEAPGGKLMRKLGRPDSGVQLGAGFVQGDQWMDSEATENRLLPDAAMNGFPDFFLYCIRRSG
jgi:hypothetical protein